MTTDSIDQHRIDELYDLIRSLVAEGMTRFRPGNIADALRNSGEPMLTYEIRGALSKLEAEGLVAVDPETGSYTLTEAARKAG